MPSRRPHPPTPLSLKGSRECLSRGGWCWCASPSERGGLGGLSVSGEESAEREVGQLVVFESQNTDRKPVEGERAEGIVLGLGGSIVDGTIELDGDAKVGAVEGTTLRAPSL